MVSRSSSRAWRMRSNPRGVPGSIRTNTPPSSTQLHRNRTTDLCFFSGISPIEYDATTKGYLTPRRRELRDAALCRRYAALSTFLS
eukprot:scaffold2560_cov397-Prasinococcus_capsulatus_cf.AAC.3